MLRALLLAGDDDASRKVRQAHRGVGLVDVLPAGSAGAVGVDPEVLVLDLDLYVLVYLRDRLHRGERRLAALVRVKRRDSHEAVDAALGLEHAESVRPLDAEVDILVARFFARLHVVFLDLPALRLGVALVHAVEHRDPVARLGAALACVELNEHVALVELAAEKRLKSELAEVFVCLGAFSEGVLEGRLLGRALLHLGELEHHASVLDRLRKSRERHDIRAFRVRRGDDFLCLRLVVPEITRRLLRLEIGELLAPVVDVDIVGHFADFFLEVFNLLPDFFDFQQLYFLFFRHDLKIIPKIAALCARRF